MWARNWRLLGSFCVELSEGRGGKLLRWNLALIQIKVCGVGFDQAYEHRCAWAFEKEE